LNELVEGIEQEGQRIDSHYQFIIRGNFAFFDSKDQKKEFRIGKGYHFKQRTFFKN